MGRTERCCIRLPLKSLHKLPRPEQKFPSLEALQTEIRKNGEETRRFFEK